MLQKIIHLEEWSDCARLRQKSDRRMMIKLRGGTTAFQIETGRWLGGGQRRVCKECGSDEVEDVEHWPLRCAPLHCYDHGAFSYLHLTCQLFMCFYV